MNAILGKVLALAEKNPLSAGASAPLPAEPTDALSAGDPGVAVFSEILGESLRAMLPTLQPGEAVTPESVPAPVTTTAAEAGAALPPASPPSEPALASSSPLPVGASLEASAGDEEKVDSESDKADSPSTQMVLPGFGFIPVQLPPVVIKEPAQGDVSASSLTVTAGELPPSGSAVVSALGGPVPATTPAPAQALQQIPGEAQSPVVSAQQSPATQPEPGSVAKANAARRSTSLSAPSGEDKVAIRASVEAPELPTPSFASAAADGLTARGKDPVLKLANGQSTQWQQPLTDALGERLSLLRENGRDSAVIRLDPPAMGQIEITIRNEAGALKVSLAATHSEVLRQLQGIGEALRQDLAQKQGAEVTVQVAQASASYLSQRDSDGGERQRRPQQQSQPGQALADADTDREALPFRLSGAGE